MTDSFPFDLDSTLPVSGSSHLDTMVIAKPGSDDASNFNPNLDVKLPQQVLGATAKGDAKANLKALRSQYQQALLKWLKQEDVPASLQQMQQALGGVLCCVPPDEGRAFWWIGCGLLDCLKLNGLPPELNVRKLLGRLDLQIRTVAEGNNSDVRPVIIEMLYLISRSHAVSELVKAIKQVYALDSHQSESLAQAHDETVQPAVEEVKLPPEVMRILAAIRDQLRTAEECWERAVQGDEPSCEKFMKQTEQLVLLGEQLDNSALQYLAKQIHQLSEYASTSEHARLIAIDMAMALLLLGKGTESYSRLSKGFQDQARILSERMQAAVKQQPEDVQQLSELVGLHHQMEQGDVMIPLATEMLVNLQSVEQGLNAFFSGSIKREELTGLLRLLGQIQGGMHISSLDKAEQLLMTIQNEVRNFIQGKDAPKQAVRYAIADAMSALENYLQHMTHGKAGDASRLLKASTDISKAHHTPVQSAPVAAPPVAPPPAGKAIASAPLPEAKPAASVPVSAPLEFAPAQPAANSPPLEFTAESSAPIVPPLEFAAESSAPVVPPLEFPAESSAPVVPPLEFTPIASVQVVPTPVFAPVESVPIESVPLATPPSAAPANRQADENQELIDIFLEEAQEVLDGMRGNLEICLKHPGGMDPLVAIRRGFHTLKGSGRMVGLTDLGEVAWCVERAMNKWLQGNKPATPGLLQFISTAVQSFGGWVGALSSHSEVKIEAEELIATAQKIEDGTDIDAAPGAPAPVAELKSQAEPIAEPAPLPELKFDFMAEPQPEPEPAPLPELEFEIGTLPLPEPEPEEEPASLPELNFDLEAAPLPEPGPPVFPEPKFDADAAAMPGLEFVDESLPGPDAEEDIVMVGAIALSQTLFNIASSEAIQNVAILQEQFDALRASAQPIVQYDFMRAAHTLVGLNRTMGFDVVVDLAHALENWLRARMDQPFTLSDGQLQMLEESIAVLGDMVMSICDQKMPEGRSDLVDQLHAEMDKIDAAAAEPLVMPTLEAHPEAVVQAQSAGMGGDTIKPLIREEPGVSAGAVPAAAASTQAPAPAARAPAPVKPVEVHAENEEPEIRDDIEEELLPVFLEEAEDLCPKIGEGLRSWRENPRDEQPAQSLKRLLHTMKGSSRMVGAMRIGEISHKMEDRVSSDAKARESAAYWDELDSDFDLINALLEELRGGKVVVMPAKAAAKEAAEVRQAETGRRATDRQGEHRGDRRATDQGGDRAALGNVLRVRSEVVDKLVNDAGEISVARSRLEAEARTFKEGVLELTASVSRLRQQLREVEIQAESQMQARVMLAKDSAEEFDPLEFDRFTRLQELTRFMNESVHDVQTIQHTLLKNLDETTALLQMQGRLSRELQQNLMNVRMVSFNSIADRLYRIVRQTGKELNKRANLELQGTGVELDRSVLEKMVAPFEHLLRNSIVHGLESDQLRVEKGKNPLGEIRLSVRQESNEVVFEFSDDGSGLNYDKLQEKAIAKGIFQQGAVVSDDQLAQLIFTSGISTAAEITEIAGRGVGMDVVRSEIVTLGGTIDVKSKRGLGTQFTIRLPLTLAVTQILLVRSGESTYAIPSTMVEQVRQVKSADMNILHMAREIEWQENIYPLHYLAQLLSDTEVSLENYPRNSLLLLRSGENRIALHVDELLGNQEAIVKNIGPQLARLSGIAGASVLGNGTVVLILNPSQLAQRASISQASNVILFDSAPVIKESAPTSVKPLNNLPLIMVVDDSLTVRKITSRMLTRAGYQVVTATDGIDALEQLEELTPEVMLLDIEMPRMDGFALARELRRNPKTQNMPIIMITSRTADKHRDYAMQLGVNTYLGKPYQEDELLQNIADFVAVHKLDA